MEAERQSFLEVDHDLKCIKSNYTPLVDSAAFSI